MMDVIEEESALLRQWSGPCAGPLRHPCASRQICQIAPGTSKSYPSCPSMIALFSKGLRAALGLIFIL